MLQRKRVDYYTFVTGVRRTHMIGILIISHGTLGESLIHCASHVLNRRPPRLRQLSITAQDDPLQMLPTARKLVKELDEGDGVLIFRGTDPVDRAGEVIDGELSRRELES